MILSVWSCVHNQTITGGGKDGMASRRPQCTLMCKVCKAPMPSITTLKQHFESKHPKIEFNPEEYEEEEEASGEEIEEGKDDWSTGWLIGWMIRSIGRLDGVLSFLPTKWPSNQPRSSNPITRDFGSALYALVEDLFYFLFYFRFFVLLPPSPPPTHTHEDDGKGVIGVWWLCLILFVRGEGRGEYSMACACRYVYVNMYGHRVVDICAIRLSSLCGFLFVSLKCMYAWSIRETNPIFWQDWWAHKQFITRR